MFAIKSCSYGRCSWVAGDRSVISHLGLSRASRKSSMETISHTPKAFTWRDRFHLGQRLSERLQRARLQIGQSISMRYWTVLHSAMIGLRMIQQSSGLSLMRPPGVLQPMFFGALPPSSSFLVCLHKAPHRGCRSPLLLVLRKDAAVQKVLRTK